MNKCDLSPAQIYKYIDSYTDALWDHILNGENFDNLVKQFSETGITNDLLGQQILNSYQESRPDFISLNPDLEIDFNVFWHIVKNNALLLSDVDFRNTVKTIQQNSFHAFMANMMQCTSKSYEDLYHDFEPLQTNFPIEERRNRSITQSDIDYRKNIIENYKNKIEAFFIEHENFVNSHPITLKSYHKKSGIYPSLIDLIKDRERFTIAYIPDFFSDCSTSLTDLPSKLKGKSVKDYAQIFSDWIQENKSELKKYSSLHFPFRIEQTSKTITTKLPTGMNKSKAYTVNHKKFYAEPIDNKLAKYIEKLETNYSRGIISQYNKIIKDPNLQIEDYNYSNLIILFIFLYLGIPSTELQKFMSVFGSCYGVGPKPICPWAPLQEVYIKYLIENGVSYQIILDLILHKL